MANSQLQVSFGSGQVLEYSGDVTVEMDSRPDGFNQHILQSNGVPQNPTTHAPGDVVYFLVYASPNVQVDEVTTSWGVLSRVGIVQSDHDEELVFENSSVAKLSHPTEAIDRIIWSGTGLGDLSIQADGKSVVATQRGMVAAHVWYRSRPTAWRLQTSAADCPAPAATAVVGVEWRHLPLPVVTP
ncbi:MAG: hypothetical protein HQM06_16665 [Magnetococcales bacterium]|nr:hypothetical protein [Magnetococcales bacterium]